MKGYDFIDWDYEFSKAITQNTTISANWQPIQYNIHYELNWGKNADDNPDTYTIEDGIILSLPLMTGYTGMWDNDGKIKQGSVGDITFIASYTINQYNVTPSIKNICTINNAGLHDYNSTVSLSLSDLYLEYEFLGCYKGGTLLSADTVYTFNIPASDITITAKLSVKEEMQNYNFTSTTDTCKITSVKDKTITSALVPDYVTSIGSSAINSERDFRKTQQKIPNKIENSLQMIA